MAGIASHQRYPLASMTTKRKVVEPPARRTLFSKHAVRRMTVVVRGTAISLTRCLAMVAVSQQARGMVERYREYSARASRGAIPETAMACDVLQGQGTCLGDRSGELQARLYQLKSEDEDAARGRGTSHALET